MQNHISAQPYQRLEQLENDPEYASILSDFRAAESAYLALYRNMTPQQQEILTEFVGKLSELHLRQLELLIDL